MVNEYQLHSMENRSKFKSGVSTGFTFTHITSNRKSRMENTSEDTILSPSGQDESFGITKTIVVSVDSTRDQEDRRGRA